MNNSIFIQEQERKILSAKKGPIKGLRNVLAQPVNNYWPVLKYNESGTLEKLLKNLLPPLNRLKKSIPWSQLQKMKREERLAIKKLNQENDANSLLRKSVVTGINAVTRGLEKKDFCSILLDSNVESAVIKHVVAMTKNENIPVLLIPFLKIVTLNTIGFASAAFALKNDVKESTNHHFHPLYETILELSANFVRPKLLTRAFSKELSNDADTEKQNYSKSADYVDVKMCTKTFTLSSNVYLNRTLPNERIFIPEGANADNDSSPPKEWGDFIPLGEDSNFTYTGDIHLNEKIRKKCTSERYMDFTEEMDTLNEKTSINNESIGSVTNSYSISTTEDKSSNKEILETKQACKKKNEIKLCATDFNYSPLRIKRMQGNSNRIKATKAAKSKKK